ncbi:MAG: tRNA uridine-5-carboxymethylaminomethyl(34) synthesis GTPase MnmE [Proteobacteria bacterium]|nr:tRNA uridine-5-carboxymethylaminomethyl(34) synthesis GTPase MnmE [Pseudomonadota bacterium]
MATETIFARASGSGVAGVAVIRISGPGVGSALTVLIGRVPQPRLATLATIHHPATREEIDSGVVLFFSSPASFTGEDVAELQVHGSPGILKALDQALELLPGLRRAEPGEFTRRAFLNGKMDLVDVEALGDLLAAETVAQARFARHYRAGLHAAAARWRSQLTQLLGMAEACIDFIDQDEVERFIDSDSERQINDLAVEIQRAAGGVGAAERLRQGLVVVLAGPPNSGKSSLLNALANREVAITSPVAGTTRDIVEAHLDIDGYPIILRDTAGLRESDDLIEQEGMRRTQGAVSQADLVIWLNPTDSPAECPIADALEIRSRADLSSSAQIPAGCLAVSATTGLGLPALTKLIGDRARELMASGGGDMIVAHERQAARLREAAAALLRAAAYGPSQLELRSEELRTAGIALDGLIGRIGADDIFDVVFSRFCIGK